MSIYKPCDIRGIAATELSPELYERWGRTLGRQLSPRSRIVIGGDVRGSTPPLLAALDKGLCRAGAEVINLGLLPTPMIYFAKRRLDAVACAIVTASHNPATINGLKWMLGERPPTPNDVATLERGAQEPSTEDGCAGGASQAADVSADYIVWLQEVFRDSSAAQLDVVLDPMHGCWAGRAKEYLQAVFPRCTFTAIRDVSDAQFGGCTPDSSRPRELKQLCEEVRRQNAQLGLAFDGDGDRIGLVDDEGVLLRPEEATWVLLHSFGSEMRGARFVYDQKFSDRTAEAARQLGAEPLVERSGHAFLRTRMRDVGALFGAEISGHYFYGTLQGGDDGLYTACRVIAHLARSDDSLAQQRSACPPVYMSPDLRVSVAPDRQAAIVAQIRRDWASYPQQTIDGVRIDLPDGWVLVRSSVTEPALTFRFEGRNAAALKELMRQFFDTLPEFRETLMAQTAGNR